MELRMITLTTQTESTTRRINYLNRIAKLLAATSIACLSASGFAAATVGQPAPSFSLKDLSGKTVQLADYKGRTVVLEWHNPGCPFVQKHYDSGNLPKLQRKVAQQVVWLAINSTNPGHPDFRDAAGYAKYMKDKGADAIPYLLDSDGKTGMSYGAQTTPHMYVVDKAGVLVYRPVESYRALVAVLFKLDLDLAHLRKFFFILITFGCINKIQPDEGFVDAAERRRRKLDRIGQHLVGVVSAERNLTLAGRIVLDQNTRCNKSRTVKLIEIDGRVDLQIFAGAAGGFRVGRALVLFRCRFGYGLRRGLRSGRDGRGRFLWPRVLFCLRRQSRRKGRKYDKKNDL